MPHNQLIEQTFTLERQRQRPEYVTAAGSFIAMNPNNSKTLNSLNVSF